MTSKPTLRDFTPEQFRALQKRKTIPVLPSHEGPLPLSYAQQRLWFLAQMEGGSEAYHIPLALCLHGPLDLPALQQALDALLARHEALRTTFETVDGEPCQRIGPADTGFLLQLDDLSHSANPSGQLATLQQLETATPFDLAHGPLLRGRLVKMADSVHMLLLTLHHIVSDGWSMGVLTRELSTLYAAACAQQPALLPPLPIQYVDYAVWQRQWLAEGALATQGDYWKTTLADAPVLLSLPTDRKRPPTQDFHGGLLPVEFDTALTAGLKALSLRLGTTLFTTVLTGWAIVLSRLSGQTDLVIGTPVANRRRSELEGLIGFFVNTLALRIDLAGTPSVETLLGRVRNGTLEAQEAQDLPFEQVVELCKPPRSLAHAPLFQVMLAWQNNEDHDFVLPGLTVERVEAPLTVAKFDLSLTLFEKDGAIVGNFDYASALFDADTIDRHRRYLTKVLQQMVASPGQTIDRLALLDVSERQQLLVARNDTCQPYDAHATLHSLFEAQAARDPQATALLLGQQRMSYGELEQAANQLAHQLQTLGVGPDRLVAIGMDRSQDMVVALLAVLKAGGAYVPLDPSYPADRLAHMLRDSAPLAVLTHPAAQPALQAALIQLDTPPAVIDLEHDRHRWANLPATPPPTPDLRSSHLAYVIYTSGTTAAAKGVLVEHRQVLAISTAWEQSLALRPGLVHLQMASFAFDVFTADVVRALGFGGRLVLCPRDTLLDSAALYQLLRQREVGFADFVPAVLGPLLDYVQASGQRLDSLETLICGSDRWSVALARQLRAVCGPATRLINAYGVTEAAIDSSYYLLPEQLPESQDTLPIGQPLANVRLYLLDAHGEPVPTGVVGELYIGGAGVARGYLNQPGLNNERFINNPFVAGERLYRTGDLARWQADGQLVFLGRQDFQIKLRGFRIELGEIESALCSCPGVQEAVVVARQDRAAEPQLVAYYTSTPGMAPPAPAAVRAHLARQLPGHMLPAAVLALDHWPLSPNGKLDRKALPAPAAADLGQRSFEAPIGPLETALAAIWAELLGVPQVGRQDHFFELGGHSLLVMRLVSRLRQLLQRDVSPTALFAAPTLATFAEALQSASQNTLPPLQPAGRSQPLPLSYAQQRLWFLAQLEGDSATYHMPLALRLQGALNPTALRQALDSLLARHEALRTRFVAVAGEAFQQIAPADTPFSLIEHDLGGSLQPDAQLAALQQTETQQPFDLANGPLIRGRLIRLTPASHVLLLTLHHIVSDGWSMGVLCHELSALYQAHCDNRPAGLPALTIQYADYAVWQRQWLAADHSDSAVRQQGHYWQQALAGAPSLLTLPTDRKRPAEQDHQGGLHRLHIDAVLTAELKAFSLHHGCTLFMTVLAGWAIVLSRLAGQTDLVIGTPVANRRRAELEGLIGFFVNTLALRLDLAERGSVRQLLAHVRTQVLAAQEAQDLPFEQVVELCKPPRSLAYAPIFQVMLAWQNHEDSQFVLPGVQVESIASPHTVAKFDLTLSLGEQDGCLVGGMDYASALFDAPTIARHCGYLREVLTQMVRQPDLAPRRLPMLDAAERQRLLIDWNRTDQHWPASTSMALFEATAAHQPEAVALQLDGQTLRYGELNAAANRLARHLQLGGVGPDQRVALCFERSLELVTALLAVLKAGGAYVPLDPAYPAARLGFMLQDAAPVVVLSHAPARPALAAALAAQATAPTVIDLQTDAALWTQQPAHDLPDTTQPEHLAYVIYTSGSTGRPKGVAQTRRTLDNLMHWQLQQASIRPPAPQRVLQFASISFDVSLQEICSTLCSGATLVMLNESARKELGQLRPLAAEQAIDRAFLPAAVLQQIAALDPGPLVAHGCDLITAGEALQVNAELRQCLQQMAVRRLYNQYGPTETHVVSQHALEVADMAQWPEAPPIGRPIANCRLYVLDAELEPVPTGVSGELYIAGAGLARAYLGRPDLTAERFLPDPFSPQPGARMYRSGDLARWRADGEIDYLGRADAQVKLRGFRIELGEIEAVLKQQAGVSDTAVLLREDEPGERQLVAYVVGSAEIDALREALRRQLPEPMQPARWLALPQLPLTVNGKLDRRALPAPSRLPGNAIQLVPRNAREAQMAAIWAQVLRRNQVGVLDDFFVLGGHSLLATRLVHAINQQMGVQIALRHLFKTPVLADLVASLHDDPADPAPAYPPLVPDPAHRFEPFPLTDIQQAYWVGREATLALGGVGAHGYGELRLRQFDEARFREALSRLVARHEMLRTVFLADGRQQTLATVPEVRLPCQDLRSLPDATAQASLQAVRERMSHQLFDASRWPLFEFAVTRLRDTEGDWVHLHISLDALIVDAASSQILERELAQLYADPASALPPLAVSFRDYVLAERALRDTPRFQRALHYWQQRLNSLPPAPALPLHRQPDSIERPHFTRRDHQLPAADWSQLKALAARHGLTPSVLLLTAFSQVLALWSRQPRFTLSLPLFNRLPLHPDINGVIGDFTSLVLLEVAIDSDLDFASQARQIQAQLWQDIDHSAVSGVQVNRELAQARGTALAAMPIVFNSTLSELAAGANDAGFASALGGETVHSITQTPQVWLDHTILEADGRLYFNWDSIDELFPPGLMAQMFAAYTQLLANLQQAESWQATLPQLLPQARFDHASSALVEAPPSSLPLLHTLFDRQALAHPEAPAVLGDGITLSYGQLRRAARALAARLQQAGVQPNTLVGVIMERGPEQLVATLAILYAGAAYLPIDPALPESRITLILQQAEARLILTQPALQSRLQRPDGLQCFSVSTADAPEVTLAASMVSEHDLAYVIFTSGSTGLPKGVMIDHRGAVNTLLDINQRFGVTAADRVLAVSSLSFDLSVFDCFGTLAAGAAVVLLTPELARDPAHWLALMTTHQVSLWNSVPALLGLLVEYAEGHHLPLPSSLRLAMLSGDWIPLSLPPRFSALLPQARVISLGGATEASIWSIYYPIDAIDPDWRSIPYGKALRHQQFYVLDDALQPRPCWVVGQLYIGGIGLAQGYWRDAERTAASFIRHPQTGERLYRTGDLGRLLPDGNIEFLGREDGQVKLQGYRVELGEIEATLESHPAVQAGVVRVWGEAHGEKRLAAYVVVTQPVEASALAAYLQARLPQWMVPPTFTFLARLPLSANGKVDRKQLPEPALPTPAAAVTVLGDDPAERRIAEIVQGILGCATLAPDDNLLVLGASSIDIVRIVNALSSELGFRPRLARLMAQATLADLLQGYREHRQQTAAAAPAVAVADPIQTIASGDSLDDPAARQQFKARQLGLRQFAHTAAQPLPLPAGDAFQAQFADFRSVRQFRPEPVPLPALGHLLASLSAQPLQGQPKRLYASAGGAYPVQTYLYLAPGRVAGMAGGAYYYCPASHRLLALGQDRRLASDAFDYFVNRPLFEQAGFTLCLIAELAAIEPLYGEKSLDFCHIEAGAMAQLLTMTAARHDLGLCGIGSLDVSQLTPLFDLGPTHRLVYTLVGGLRAAGQTGIAAVEQFTMQPAAGDENEGEDEMEEVEI
ncbi:non-ribosomal peptide synthetase [Parachitinimonas caeni]|uniref:Amino acid adenylation domain-containing protein n=1 Tax=Parachitinimonas caeni TaxID=3031301 RepID=A0ABT7E1V2_9NEIS|nr:non-ribosomal peptide synthetase [Parachitinimonas caeni]MDK2126024.1 amino acid adenylation domain-containing protein [Parachitinimonas caeni]